MKLFAILILGGLIAFPTGAFGECNDPPAPRVDWAECDKKGADLEGAILSGAILTDADLSGANLEKGFSKLAPDSSGPNLMS